jgi:hypothetical protein
MNQIKFSHIYPKLWGQTSGRLLFVQLLKAKDVHENKDLLEYDTRYSSQKSIEMDREFDEYYPLPKSGNLIHLTFLGDKNIPFSTMRPEFGKGGYNKLSYYQSRVGQNFEVIIKDG